jgi:hypothetical protein
MSCDSLEALMSAEKLSSRLLLLIASPDSSLLAACLPQPEAQTKVYQRKCLLRSVLDLVQIMEHAVFRRNASSLKFCRCDFSKHRYRSVDW